MRKVFPLVSFLIISLLFSGCFTGSVTFHDLTPSANETVPTVKPTETSEPASLPNDFTADPLVLPSDQAEYLTGCNAAEAWPLLADAISKELPFVEFASPEISRCVTDIFEYTPLSGIAELAPESETVHIEYNAAHSIDTLTDSITALINDSVSSEHNRLETLISLYRTAASFEFDETSEPSLYRTLLNGKGDTKEITLAFQHLLTQAGFETKLAYASNAEHYWVIAKLNDSFYHFDPVFEAAATNGQGLSYFGMSDTAHAAAIGSSAYQIGYGDFTEQTTGLCFSDTLDSLFSDVSSYEMNVGEHLLTVQFGFNPENTAEYSTNSF